MKHFCTISARNSVDCVYINFSKASDSVVHSKLCLKLTFFGFQGKVLHCIAAFLHGRTQSVRVGKYYSDPCDVISGEPQGSVLGPLFSERSRSLYAIAVRLSSVCLSCVVYNVRAPTQATEIFGNVSTAFGTLAICDFR